MNNILVPANYPATTIQTKHLYMNTTTTQSKQQPQLPSQNTKQFQMLQQTQNNQDDLDFVLHYDDVKILNSNRQQPMQLEKNQRHKQQLNPFQIQTQQLQVQELQEINMIMDDFDFNLNDFSITSNSDIKTKSNMQQIPVSNTLTEKSSPQSFYG
jgi:hypothetical protein